MSREREFGWPPKLGLVRNAKWVDGDYIIYNMYRPGGEPGAVKGLTLRIHRGTPRGYRLNQLRQARKQLRLLGGTVVA